MEHQIKNYYGILSVHKNSSIEEITKKYKEKIKYSHPDNFKNQTKKILATKNTVLLNEAYSNLTDPTKKNEFDSIYDFYFSTIPSPYSLKKEYGPFHVSKDNVDTSISVNKGDIIRTLSKGTVWFSMFGPILSANGETYNTPDNYPAPNLLKNSLICLINNTFYQGGNDRYFVSNDNGQLYLRTNDSFFEDNFGTWEIYVLQYSLTEV